MDGDVQGRLEAVSADLLRLRLELLRMVAENEQLIAQAERLTARPQGKVASSPWTELRTQPPLPHA